MSRCKSLVWCMTGIALIGCNRQPGQPSAANTPASGPISPLVAFANAEANPTAFFNFCSGDVVSIGFPTDHMAAGPGGSHFDVNMSSASGGTVKVETYGTRRSTPEEAEAMMRKLHSELRRTAQEKGCQVEEPAELSDQEAAAGFTLKYSKQNNSGEVVVTRSERTEKEYQDKDGVPVYTIKVSVSEKVSKPAG